ncbi:EAL domain-containing protein [Deinococcus sp. JMULE3]|uniref:sensor domain-containing protein n=1 Tax=Deinococcus sp. JMULE3 TaxID=2518341 RepID=UPI001576A716|nr:EAL domain-containing protein [Deinococcus sp. JMULE3]
MDSAPFLPPGTPYARHRSQMLEAVFQHSPIGKALVSTEGQFITVNPAMSNILGYEAETLKQLTFQEITHPDDLEADLTLLRELSRGERDHYTMVKRYRHRDGHLVWAQLDVAMVVEDSGVPAFYIAQIQDATDRLDHERALTDRLRLALDATQDGIWDWELPRPDVTVSTTLLNLTGLTARAETISARAWLRLVHPADRHLILTALRSHLRGEQARIDVTCRQRQPDRRWRWVSLRGRVTRRNDAGHATRLTGTLGDVDGRVRAQQDLQVLLDHLPAMIGYWDCNLEPRFANRTLLTWSEPDGHGPETPVHPFPLDTVRRALNGEEQRCELQVNTRKGTRQARLHLIPDRQDGEVLGVFALGVDITDLRETERALFEQKELARVTLKSIGDSVVTTDPHGRVTSMNTVAQRMTGWTLEEAMGQPVETVMPLTDEASGQPLPNPLRIALTEHRPQGMAPGALLTSRDGRTYRVEDSAAPITTEQGQHLGGVIVFHDVTEKRALSDHMTYLAQHDALTDLPNRTLLQARLQYMTELSGRQDSTFVVAFLDLDGFKTVNDTLGHAVGDDLLRQVAGRLRSHLRSSDTLSRVGGDEFVLLLPAPITRAQAERATDKLLARLRDPFTVGDHEVRVSASIGAVIYPHDGQTGEELMKRADLAMYRAKASGRNRVCYFDASQEREEIEKHRLVQALQLAVDRQQFDLAYQPKVDGRTGQITGVEALLRWSPDGQPVAPNRFIHVVEELGQMKPLGRWVLTTACQQGQQWLEAGHPLQVAVNVSPVQFRDPDFVATVREALDRTGFPPHLLELEVTESVLMHEVGRVKAVLTDLRDLGVHTAIDDFGTGYSSLSYLHALPLDILKIDRAFVSGAMNDARSDALLRGIVSLARALNLNLTAEGVETDAERRHLLDIGCETMQGFLFAPPMSPADLRARLAQPAPALHTPLRPPEY